MKQISKAIIFSAGLISLLLNTEISFAQSGSPSPIPESDSPPTDPLDPANYKNSEAACLQEASNREMAAHKESYTRTPCIMSADDEQLMALTSEKSKTFACIYNPNTKKWLVYLSSEWNTSYKWTSTLSPRYGCLATAYMTSDYLATYGACYSTILRGMTTWNDTIERVTGFNISYSYPTGSQGMPKINYTLGTLNGFDSNINCGLQTAVYSTWRTPNMPIIYAPTIRVPN